MSEVQLLIDPHLVWEVSFSFSLSFFESPVNGITIHLTGQLKKKIENSLKAQKLSLISPLFHHLYSFY